MEGCTASAFATRPLMTTENALNEDSDFLRQFLAGRDVPCPMCKYNLRDLVGNRCPECGRSITLAVKAAEFNLATFTAGVVILAAGAGFFVVAFLCPLLCDNGVPVPRDVFWLVSVVLAINAAAIHVWIRSWRLLSTGPLRRRLFALCSCVLVTAGSFYGFVTYLR